MVESIKVFFPPFLLFLLVLHLHLTDHTEILFEILETGNALQRDLSFFIEATGADDIDGTDSTLSAFRAEIWGGLDIVFEAIMMEVMPAGCLD